MGKTRRPPSGGAPGFPDPAVIAPGGAGHQCARQRESDVVGLVNCPGEWGTPIKFGPFGERGVWSPRSPGGIANE